MVKAALNALASRPRHTDHYQPPLGPVSRLYNNAVALVDAPRIRLAVRKALHATRMALPHDDSRWDALSPNLLPLWVPTA